MRIDRISNTCSMYELGSISQHDINNPNFYKELNKLINDTIIGNKQEKVIIYNTNFTWCENFNERLKLRAAGFRKIGSYKGRWGNPVSILLKKLK